LKGENAMSKFLKDLVEMLAVSAYSEIGDRGFDCQDIAVKSAPVTEQRTCQVLAEA
jgi:hypothetical protein